MTQQIRIFNVGDRVRHTTRPEWGVGTIQKVQAILHEGHKAQRLSIEFERNGRMTLNSAVANLISAEENKVGIGITTDDSKGWLNAMEKSDPKELLMSLPDSTGDLLSGLATRLDATLDLYRYSTEPASLIEWAAVQLSISDPLSQFTRPELEQHFDYYAMKRDAHLRELVRAIQREGRGDVLKEALAKTSAPARKALAKAIVQR